MKMSFPKTYAYPSFCVIFKWVGVGYHTNIYILDLSAFSLAYQVYKYQGGE